MEKLTKNELRYMYMVVKCHFRGLAFLKLDCITSNLIFSLIKNEYTLFLYGIEQLEVESGKI